MGVPFERRKRGLRARCARNLCIAWPRCASAPEAYRISHNDTETRHQHWCLSDAEDLTPGSLRFQLLHILEPVGDARMGAAAI